MRNFRIVVIGLMALFLFTGSVAAQKKKTTKKPAPAKPDGAACASLQRAHRQHDTHAQPAARPVL